MAIQNYMPYPAARDWVTYDEAVELLAETDHEVSMDDLRKWVKQEGLPARGRGRKAEVPFSDLLLIHAEKVDQGEV